MISTRVPLESSDTVSSIVALLVRFPEISSLWSHPTDGTIRLTYAVSKKLPKLEQRELAVVFHDHIGAFAGLEGRDAGKLRVRCETDQHLSFIHVIRASASFTREELTLHIGLLAERYGDALVRNPVEEPIDEDAAAADDEAVEHAIDAMRDPSQKKSLVGYREEKRVLVYFLKTRKAKAPARR